MELRLLPDSYAASDASAEALVFRYQEHECSAAVICKAIESKPRNVIFMTNCSGPFQ